MRAHWMSIFLAKSRELHFLANYVQGDDKITDMPCHIDKCPGFSAHRIKTSSCFDKKYVLMTGIIAHDVEKAHHHRHDFYRY